MPDSVALTTETRGILPIVPTPFNDDGGLALGDIPRLVDFYEECGVGGLTVLGRMGEAEKLSTEETDMVVREFIRHAKGRMPVLIGISGGLARTIEHGKAVLAAGADGAMFRPLSGSKGDDAVVTFFERYVEGTKGAVPICVQDDPQVNGVNISIDAWCRISKLDPILMIKLEPVPALQKLSRIIDAQNSGAAKKVAVFPSFNGMHLPQLLDRGANGVMAGFAFTDALVAVIDMWSSGDRDRAQDLHDALMPIMRYKREFPLVLRKEILRRRGVLSSNHVRYPGTKLEARDIAELNQLLARTERRLSELSFRLVGDASFLSSG